jgi:hypothetical protein
MVFFSLSSDPRGFFNVGLSVAVDLWLSAMSSWRARKVWRE